MEIRILSSFWKFQGESDLGLLFPGAGQHIYALSYIPSAASNNTRSSNSGAPCCVVTNSCPTAFVTPWTNGLSLIKALLIFIGPTWNHP